MINTALASLASTPSTVIDINRSCVNQPHACFDIFGVFELKWQQNTCKYIYTLILGIVCAFYK